MTQGVQNLASEYESNCCIRQTETHCRLGGRRRVGSLGWCVCSLWRTRHEASSTIVYEIEPGKRLGWHSYATEETQYIIAGDGELHMEDGSKHSVGPGSVFVLPSPVKHDLVNVGNETLRAVAFFAAAMFTQISTML